MNNISPTNRFACVLSVFLVLILCSSSCVKDPERMWESGELQTKGEITHYTLIEEISFNNKNDFPLKNIEMNVSVYRDTPFQRVSVESKPPYDKTFTDKLGNTYIHISMDKIQAHKNGTISIRNSMNVTSNEFSSLDFQMVEGALEPTKNIQSDYPLIRMRAKQITKGLKTRRERVEAIHSYVTKNFTYKRNNIKRDAVGTIKEKVGNCDSLSNLFIALCRAAGIPSLKAHGYVASGEEEEGGSHAWALVRIDGEWMQVECTNSELYDGDDLDKIYFAKQYNTGLNGNYLQVTYDYPHHKGEFKGVDFDVNFHAISNK